MITLWRQKCALAAASAILVVTVGAQVSHAQRYWQQKIDGPQRFHVVQTFGGQAVLDNETGLLWERSPTPNEDGQPFITSRRDALITCAEKTVGGRKGWRLPKIEELMSLVEVPQVPSLPSGHPFVDIDPDAFFWSATTVEHGSGLLVGFNGASNAIDLQGTDNQNRFWCVRGGVGHDGGQ